MEDTKLTGCVPSADGGEPFAYVANVQRFTVHDGPGIRTELFLKGCPLRCKWCSNPETYERAPQVGVHPEKCIGCGYCLKACARHGKNALLIGENHIVGIDRTLCDNCLLCEEECMSGALTIWGQKMTVSGALDVILKDRNFYEKSGGGMTLSGGEALLQWEFCLELLKRCKEAGIHTCVESALYIKPEILDKVVPYIDLFITDIKQMDSEIHRAYTGVPNERILSNIKKLSGMGMPMIIRMPIIPGFNDTEEFIDRASDFILRELHNAPEQIQLLKYRPLGEEKAGTLGLPMEMKAIKIEDREGFEQKIKDFARRMNDKGIPAIAGSRAKSAPAAAEQAD